MVIFFSCVEFEIIGKRVCVCACVCMNIFVYVYICKFVCISMYVWGVGIFNSFLVFYFNLYRALLEVRGVGYFLEMCFWNVCIIISMSESIMKM